MTVNSAAIDTRSRLLDIALKIEDGPESLLIGVRKLGIARLKGLDTLPIYEIVDAALWGDNTLVEVRGAITELVEREFNAVFSG